MDIYVNDIYYHALNSDARVIVLYGGADSGKSYFTGAQYIPLNLVGKDYFRGLLVRKVGSTLRDSVFQEVLDGIGDLGRSSLFRFNHSIHEIVYENGNKVICKGLDKVPKLKSIKGINFVWIEEAEEINEAEFDNLLLRLRGGSYEWLMLTFNPVDEEHFSYHRFHSVEKTVIERDAYGEPKVWSFLTSEVIDGEDVSYQTLVIKSTYRDNKFISPQRKLAIENLKHNNPELYEILGRGNYVSLGERIFSNWEIVNLSDEEESTFDTIRYGIDWGYYPDPFRFLVVNVDTKRKEITVIDEVNLIEKTNSEAVRHIKPLLHTNYKPIVADSAEPKSIKDFRNHGIRVVAAKKGPDSVDYGIKKLHEYKIKVNQKCVHTIQDLKGYKRKKDRDGKVSSTPVDAFNHSVDVLRYIMEEFDSNDSRFVNVKI